MRLAVSRLAGARARGLVLIAIVALPLLAATILSYARDRADARDNAQQRALNIAALAQHEYQLKVDSARQFLATGYPLPNAATLSAAAQNPSACNRTLAGLLKENPGYLNLFMTGLDGIVFCSALPTVGVVNLSDRDYIGEVLRTGRPAVGAPVMGRVSFRPTVVVGSPVKDDQGKLIAIVGVSIDFSTTVNLAPAVELPPGSSVTMLDKDGIVLARNIDGEKWIGKPGPEVVGLPTVVATGGDATATGIGVDGVSRLYGIVAQRPTPDGTVQGTLLVGIPTAVAYGPAENSFNRNITWLTAVTLVAMVAAWFGSERLVIAPLRRVTEATQRIARGEFGARTGLSGQGGEVGIIAAAVDHMAAELARTHAERDRDRLDLESILSAVPNVVASVEPDGTVTRINRAVERRFGWPEGDFVGRNIELLYDARVFPLADDSVPPLTECNGQRRDGSTFPVEVEVRRIVGGNDRRYLVVVRDLTARRQGEADRELARVASARAEFLRTLSHELRSPLTAVLGFAQLLSRTVPEATQRRQAQDIESAGQHMLTLVNDLLDLARIDAGRWDVSFGEIDVAELLRGVTEGLRPLAAAKGLTLSVGLSEEAIFARTDERVLREVVTNLTENAVKYTDEGGVQVLSARGDNWLEVQVCDTGVGIPSDRLESIFDEFERLRASSTQAGTGLGLAITRKLVTLLGGRIGVTSTVGAGSVFTVRLPVEADSTGAAPPAPTASAVAPTAS